MIRRAAGAVDERSRPMHRSLDAETRRRLRHAITARHRWVDDGDIGPRSVEAGDCDRCGLEARLVAVCGPVPWAAIGRRCARELGTRAWCDGHAGDVPALLDHLGALPAEADTVARLWWVATGELRLDAQLAAALAAQHPDVDSDPA